MHQYIFLILERIRNDHQNDLTKYGFDVNSLNELFFLWKLCGSTVESILIRTGAIRGRPPVLTLPRFMTLELFPRIYLCIGC